MPKEPKSSFFSGAAILAAGIVVVKIIGAIYKIPIVNVLGTGYADFSNAYYIYALLLTISTAGLPVALSKMVAAANARQEYHQTQKIFRVSMSVFVLLGLLSFLVMFFFADKLAELLHDPLAALSIRVLSPAVICVGCLSSFRGYAQGHSNMVPTAVSQIIEALIKLVVGLGLAIVLVKRGAEGHVAAAGAIAGVTLGTVAALIYMVIEYAGHHNHPRSHDKPSSSGAILKELLMIAVPVTLSSSAFSIINLIDTSLVQGRLQKALDMTLEESRELFSAYSGVTTLYNLPASLMVALTAALIPAISAANARGDRRGASRTVGAAFRLTALFVLPMGVGLSVLATPIVRLLFSRLDPEVSGPLLSILGIASICVCIMTVSNSILQAYGYERLPVYVMIAGGVIKVVVNYNLVGIPQINIKGAPIGTLCCFAFSAVADLILIKRIVPHPPRYRRSFRGAILASALMGGAAFGSYRLASQFCGNTVATAAAIVVAVAVYAGAVLFLGLLTKQDVLLMPKGEKIAKLLHL